jgi:DNA-binding transcriptional LysR family regulator
MVPPLDRGASWRRAPVHLLESSCRGELTSHADFVVRRWPSAVAVALQQLTYFVTVAAHGNLMRAAAALHLAQPSLSTQIRRLECDLGTDLFERVPRGVALTPAGASLLPIARQALADVEQIRRTANELTSPDGGTLRVGATPSRSTVLLPAALTGCHALHGQVALEFVEAGSEDLIERLERDELDLALVSMPVPHRAVETVPLAEEDLVVIVGPGHALAGRKRLGISELRGVPLVIPRVGYTIRTTVFAACRYAGFEPTVACDGGELSGVIALVARGLGAAVIPNIAATHQPGLCTIGIDRPRLVRMIGLARRAGAIGPASARTFTSELFELLHDAGWPGVRPLGLRLPSGTSAHP